MQASIKQYKTTHIAIYAYKLLIHRDFEPALLIYKRFRHIVTTIVDYLIYCFRFSYNIGVHFLQI